MRIGDPPKTSRTRVTSPTQKPATAKAAAAPSGVDEIALSGIPTEELTPKVQSALASLMQDVMTLREELAAARQHIAELEEVADRDPLVNALNRRAFVRELERTQALADRYNILSCLVFIDMNDLKKLNDTYGHGAGDAALSHLANTVIGNTRQTDILGRIGGDEFALILTHVAIEAAEQKAQFLSSVIEQTPLQWKDEAVPVSVSFGIVGLDAGSTAEAALESADAAMYENKKEKAKSSPS